ncbi:hypothetical protein C8Q74DRAFT_165249 [Fomes fomentarius]|nr:hypothetical protein C8Q74DRAFT_165249 [Fomes fomentarius]
MLCRQRSRGHLPTTKSDSADASPRHVRQKSTVASLVRVYPRCVLYQVWGRIVLMIHRVLYRLVQVWVVAWIVISPSESGPCSSSQGIRILHTYHVCIIIQLLVIMRTIGIHLGLYRRARRMQK